MPVPFRLRRIPRVYFVDYQSPKLRVCRWPKIKKRTEISQAFQSSGYRNRFANGFYDISIPTARSASSVLFLESVSFIWPSQRIARGRPLCFLCEEESASSCSPVVNNHISVSHS